MAKIGSPKKWIFGFLYRAKYARARVHVLCLYIKEPFFDKFELELKVRAYARACGRKIRHFSVEFLRRGTTARGPRLHRTSFSLILRENRPAASPPGGPACPPPERRTNAGRVGRRVWRAVSDFFWPSAEKIALQAIFPKMRENEVPGREIY